MAASEHHFRPRRGTKSVLEQKNPVLLKGELIVEIPDAGYNKGKVCMKIGDGKSAYNDLVYAVKPTDVSATKITFSASSSTDPTVLLNEIVTGKTVAKLFGSIKTLLSDLNTRTKTLETNTGGIKIVKVSSLPANPDPKTLYLINQY